MLTAAAVMLAFMTIAVLVERIFPATSSPTRGVVSI
jgi:hypothetical protein